MQNKPIRTSVVFSRLAPFAFVSTLVGAVLISIVPKGQQQGMVATALAAPNPTQAPFRDALMPPTPGWTGNVFHLSQSYPATAPADAKPWLQYDPVTQPNAYIKSVLDYFYAGNIRPNVESSFNPALNPVRKWYNAPWQDQGVNGREFVHGLTRERVSKPGELAASQTQQWNNYAVGFYNAPGGVAIGRMWANHQHPNAQLASMPEGTVAAKLLFTTAPVSEARYLQGSPTWKGYVYANVNDPNPTATSPRAVTDLRLLQIDIAVKDSRLNNLTGWAFGTFVYGGGPHGTTGSGIPGSGWSNVAPVGLMWGNDPGYSGSGPLRETWLNPSVKMPHVGYQGRLNGPVDNKVSSCISCHSTAETPPGAMIPSGDPAPWFRNIPSGVPFNQGRQSLDYSLQLAVGLANFNDRQQISMAPTVARRLQLIQRYHRADTKPPRDGGNGDRIPAN